MQHRERAKWILEQVGRVNPYRRQQENRKSEFYIYQGGFLAGFLASLMESEPEVAHSFRRHIASQYRR